MAKTRSMSARERWAIASRVLAATAGGYAFAALSSAVIAASLPLMTEVSRAQAVLASTLLSFATYTVVALAVFCARSAGRAWAGLAMGTACAAVLLLAARAAVA